MTKTNQTFWKKNEGETVPETLSNNAATFCIHLRTIIHSVSYIEAERAEERGSGRNSTFSKNSPVSSSKPGKRAKINAFVAGLRDS